MSTYAYEGIDPVSFYLGMTEAFCEIVAGGIKPLALSTPFDPALRERFEPLSDRVAAKYGVATYTETDFPPTDMLPQSETDGKVVILYFTDSALKESYLALREQIAKALAENRYDAAERAARTRDFRRLLGYPVN